MEETAMDLTDIKAEIKENKVVSLMKNEKVSNLHGYITPENKRQIDTDIGKLEYKYYKSVIEPSDKDKKKDGKRNS